MRQPPYRSARRRPGATARAVVCAALLAALAGLPPRGASATDEADDDRVFTVDPRGVIFPLDGSDEALDMVLLGQLRERYYQGIVDLDAGRWAAAAEALEEVCAELAVPEVMVAAAIAQYQLEHHTRAQQLLELSLIARPDDLRARNLLGLVLGALGQPEAARGHLERCRELAAADDNRSFEAFAMLNLAQVELDLGHPDEAERLTTAALELGRGRRFGNVVAVAHNALGNVALYRGDLREAERRYRKSMQIERRGRGNDDQAALLNNLANVLAARGDLDGASELLAEAIEEARAQDRRSQQGGILVTRAGIENQRGRPGEARRILEEALALFRQLELARGQVEVRLQQARVARSAGDADEADEYLALAHVAARDVALPHLMAELELLACEVSLDRGDAGAARTAAERARSWYLSAERARDTGAATLCWAEALAGAGQLAEAERAYAEAHATLAEVEDEARLADVRQRRGLFLVRLGRVEEGTAELDRALAWLAAQGRDRERALSLNLLGHALGEQGRLEEAVDRLAEGAGAAELAGDEAITAMIRGNRVQLLVRLGRTDAALAVAGPDPPDDVLRLVAMARAREAFDRGLTAMDAERWSEAAGAMEQVLEAAPADDRTIRPAARSNLRMIEHHRGLVALERRDLPAATRHLERALEHMTHEEDAAAEARLLRDLGVLRAEVEDADGALRYLDQALIAAAASGEPQLERSVQFQLGLATMETDTERSRAALRRAIELAPDVVDELGAATRYNLAILLYRVGEPEASRAAFEESRALYDALGMEAQVAVIDEYLEEFPPGG